MIINTFVTGNINPDSDLTSPAKKNSVWVAAGCGFFRRRLIVRGQVRL